MSRAEKNVKRSAKRIAEKKIEKEARKYENENRGRGLSLAETVKLEKLKGNVPYFRDDKTIAFRKNAA